MGRRKSDTEWLEEARQACEGEHYEVLSMRRDLQYNVGSKYKPIITTRKYSRVYLNILCKVHGLEFEMIAPNFMRGNRCRQCFLDINPTLQRKTIEDWRSELAGDGGIQGFHYISLDFIDNGSYKAAYLEIRCLECGYTFKRRPGNLKICPTCPNCYISEEGPSSGHLLVREALETLGFVRVKDFSEEKTFPTCVYKKELPFDFYLKEYRCLIEYQGRQHYRYVEYFHGTPEGFEEQLERDRVKKEWCEYNGYLLLRIPYTVDRLDLIVKGLIERLGL